MIASEFGQEVHELQCKNLLNELCAVFELEDEIKEFIGAHPVTLDHKQIQCLIDNDYLVCEKTDGIRLMLFVYEGVLYLYDRKNKFYRTDLIFKTPHLFLFDGEMYLERGKYLFAAFDCLIFHSEAKIQKILNKRLGYCFEFENIVKKGYIKRKDDSIFKNFYIIGKQMFKSYSFPEILERINHLEHENDGLIFTPVNEPYILGSRSKIFKWKPPYLNTVDFLIKKTENPSIFSLQCNVYRDQVNMIDRNSFYEGFIHFSFYFSDEDSPELDNKIGEFSYDHEKDVIDVDEQSVDKGGWCLHRIRTDKDSPNNIKVVLDTMESIKESITIEELKRYQDEIMKNYKERAKTHS